MRKTVARKFIEAGMYVDAVWVLFDAGWKSTKSEDGYERMLQWMTGRDIAFEYGQDKIITRVYANGWQTNRAYI